MSLLLKRQIERLELAIELSTDWLEIQYLRAELDQLKDLYEEPHAGVAWSKLFVQDACQLLAAEPWIVWPMHSPAVLTFRNCSNQRKKGSLLIQWDALTDFMLIALDLERSDPEVWLFLDSAMVMASSVADASSPTTRSPRVRIVCVNRGKWFLQVLSKWWMRGAGNFYWMKHHHGHPC